MSTPSSSALTGTRLLLAIGALAALYYLAARLGLLLAFEDSNASPVWPPSGVALAALLRFGVRLWPAVLLGAFAANVAVFLANGLAPGPQLWLLALAIAFGNSAEAVLAHWALRRRRLDEGVWLRPLAVAEFAAIAALAALLAALVGVGSLSLAGLAPAALRITIASTWWLGDLTAMLVLTPALLLLGRPSPSPWQLPAGGERLLAAVIAAALLGWLFALPDAGATQRWGLILLLPALALAALRYGPQAAALLLLAIAAVATAATTQGRGPFASGTLNESLSTLQWFIALSALAGGLLVADLNDRRPSSGRLSRRWLSWHWMIGLIGGGASVLAWSLMVQSTEQAAQVRFQAMANEIQDRLHDRVGDYQQALRAGLGLITSSEQVTGDEWRRFVAELNLADAYPGMLGLGYARVFPAERRALVEQQQRQQGLADFQIWPSSDAAWQSTIIYLEPQTEPNRRALGYDMSSEAVRRAAMEQARIDHRPTLSGKITLVQDAGAAPQAGFLLYLADAASPPAGEAVDSAAAVRGFVYAAFRAAEVMNSVFPRGHYPLRLELFDGEEIAATSRLFDSDGGQRPYPNALSSQWPLQLAQHRWTLRLTTLEAFERGIDRQKSVLTLAGGLALSLLLFFAGRTVHAAGEQAAEQAERMTQAFAESELRLATLIDAASEFSIIATDPGGTIKVFSAGASRMLGYRAEEMIDRQTPALIHLAEEVAARQQELSQQLGRPIAPFEAFVALAAQGHPETREWTYVRRDGSRLPVQLTVQAIRDRQRQLSGFLGIARDISSERAAALALQQAKEQAEQASRAKGEFVANMSHEIRTPMNAVLGLAHLLDSTPLSPDQKRYLDMLQGAGESLLAVLNDVLDFSKIEAGKLEVVNAEFALDELLDPLASMMAINAGSKPLELAIGVAQGVPRRLHGDVLRLQQVLLNLLGNALKFTAEGAVSLRVEAEALADDRLLLRARVRDSGIGMSAEQLGRLFQAFNQADASMTRRFGGTGLGLAISRRLAELMGGTLEVQSELGRGSEFVLSVPLQALPPAPQQTLAARLLLIEPQSLSRELIATTLSACGAEVAAVDSIAAALPLLAPAAPPYQAVLLAWPLAATAGSSFDPLLPLLATECRLFLLTAAAGHAAWQRGGGHSQVSGVLIKPLTCARLLDALQPAETSAQTLQHDQLRPLQGLHCLLVEDNPLNQVVARGVLELAGATLEIAGDGAQAIEALRQRPQRFQLVLMDVQMPVLDGISATRQIRQQLDLKLPIVAMSAGVLASERADCREAGMDDFISKPFVPAELIATLQNYLPASSTAVTAAASPARLGGPVAVFDCSRVDALRAAPPALHQAMLALLRRQLENGPAAYAAALEDWRQGRLQSAASYFHSLRGSLGQFASVTLVELSSRLEHLIASADQHAVEALLAEFGPLLQLWFSQAGSYLLADAEDSAGV